MSGAAVVVAAARNRLARFGAREEKKKHGRVDGRAAAVHAGVTSSPPERAQLRQQAARHESNFHFSGGGDK